MIHHRVRLPIQSCSASLLVRRSPAAARRATASCPAVACRAFTVLALVASGPALSGLTGGLAPDAGPRWADGALQAQSPAASAIRGVVVDSATGAPIPGARVRLVEVNRDETTHLDGSFTFSGVTAGRYTLFVNRAGYQPSGSPAVVGAGLSGPIRIVLSGAPATLDPVIVTGTLSSRSRDDVLSPTSVLTAGTLDRALGTTLAATIEAQPGVAMTSIGPATGRPVLRGLSGDRVLVLEDGLRPGDLSSTSGDHAVAIEPLTARQIEVVRGPMSLLYGSSALGGVVNVVRDEIPVGLPEHPHGVMSLQGASANRGLTGGGYATAALGRVALRAEASARDGGDLQTPDGPLENTQLRSYNLSGGASYVADRGHVGGAYRYYANDYGIPGGFVGSHPNGVDIVMRRHMVRGEAVARPGNTLFEDLRLTTAYTDYSHQEFEAAGVIGTSFAQRLAATDLIGHNRAFGPFSDGAVGLRAQYRDVQTGGSLRTPSTQDYSLAGFVVQERELGPLRLQGGLRYDWARFEPRTQRFVNVGGTRTATAPRTFGAFSGSLGALYELRDGIRIGTNVSRAYRTPDFNELYSDGPHLAAYSYDVGNPALDEETGIGVDVFARITRQSFRAEVAAFRNEMSGYVFPRNTGLLGRVGQRPQFQYTGQDAVLTGVEGEAQVHLSSTLSLDATASYVRGTLAATGDSLPAVDGLPARASSRFLPLMPAPNARLMLRYDVPRWFIGGGGRVAARQNRLGDFETETAGYGVVDLVGGVRLPFASNVHSITLRIDNALNQSYRNHLSRTKLVMPEAGRNVQLLYRLSF